MKLYKRIKVKGIDEPVEVYYRAPGKPKKGEEELVKLAKKIQLLEGKVSLDLYEAFVAKIGKEFAAIRTFVGDDSQFGYVVRQPRKSLRGRRLGTILTYFAIKRMWAAPKKKDIAVNIVSFSGLKSSLDLGVQIEVHPRAEEEDIGAMRLHGYYVPGKTSKYVELPNSEGILVAPDARHRNFVRIKSFQKGFLIRKSAPQDIKDFKRGKLENAEKYFKDLTK